MLRRHALRLPLVQRGGFINVDVDDGARSLAGFDRYTRQIDVLWLTAGWRLANHVQRARGCVCLCVWRATRNVVCSQ